MKTYHLDRNSRGQLQVVVMTDTDSASLTPDASKTVRNHSNDFDMGNVGPGSAQLAVALLLDAKDAVTANRLAQKFHRDVVAKFDPTFAEITDADILAWVSKNSFSRPSRPQPKL